MLENRETEIRVLWKYQSSRCSWVFSSDFVP